MIKRDTNMNIIRIRILLAMLCLPCTQVGAADTAGVDTSDWECEYCLFEQGYSGEIEAGIGHVSDESFKFGEYNGLENDGAHLIGNAMTRYRDENGRYLDLRIRDLGLDTRNVGIEGGRQGSYSLFLDYDGIPHNISDSARTPYLGNGSDTLTLPAGWVPAGTTGGMTGLAASLQDVKLETMRKRLGIGASFIPASKWETAIKVRHELRDGQKRTAGDFFQSAQLVEPVDYVTDEVDVSVTYTTRKWQSRLAYYGSFFSNDDESLTWQKAYSGFPNVATGALALPPDNQFHQFQFASGYQLSERTRISGDVALGRMEQDENLLPASTIANPQALPRSSTQAEINTTTANLKIDSAVSKKLRLNAAIRYNDRDNDTPLDLFPTYLAETIGPTSVTNRSYSFTDKTAKLGGSYRFTGKTRLSAGYEYETRERTNQEVDETKENTVWGKLNVRARDNIDVTFKAEHGERDTSGYNPEPTQNPLMRKYNLADRKRDSGGIHAGFTPHERVSIGLGFDISKDDYTESVLGLTESREYSVNADAAVMLSEATSMHVFAGRQQIKSDQAGSQAFVAPPPNTPPTATPPDWFARNEDTVDSFGIGVKHQLIEDKLDVGIDYVLSRSTGEVRVDDGSPGADFPDLVADLDTVKLYANYHLKDNVTLRAAYWYEDYNSEAWYLDGVDPATIPTVISFGEDSPDYTVHAVMLSIRYKF